MSKWKLYWVETPDETEDCFVVAKTARSAAAYDETGTGFDRGDCSAHLVCNIPDSFEKIARQELEKWDAENPEFRENRGSVWPDYARDWLIELLGGVKKIEEGREVTEIAGQEFTKGTISELYFDKEPETIKSVAEFVAKVAELNEGRWLFRGQTNALWPLKCGLDRKECVYRRGNLSRAAYDNKLVEQFKRYARPYLRILPANESEWLFLAQHHGLPTRLLDWSTNPLVALFFAVNSRQANWDGVVFSYQHNRDPLNFQKKRDPTALATIEWCEPPHLNERIVAQSSVFTVEPDAEEDENSQSGRHIHTWHVNYRFVDEIRETLGKMGISQMSMFPSLDSVCQKLRAQTY